MTWMRWVGLLCLGWSASAQAEVMILDFSDGDPQCRVFAGSDCVNDASCGAGFACRDFGADGRVCVPRTALFCCGEGSACPTGDPVATACTPVSSVSGSGDLCLPAERYCDAELTLERVVACHTVPGSATRPVPYAQGDCDGDGLSNIEEANAGTDVCVAPTDIGVQGDGACITLTMGCSIGQTCPLSPAGTASTCIVTPDGNGTYCSPGPQALYCCDATHSCPIASDQCIGALCIADDCAGVPGVDPVMCILDADGNHVPYPQGDCDGDGTANGGDTDQCTPPLADAGVVEVDAGGADTDAGGDGIQPRFEGGGGCVCRASAPSSAPAWALAIAAMLMVLRRR